MAATLHRITAVFLPFRDSGHARRTDMCMCRCVFGKKARKQQFERLWIGFTRLASGPELVDEVHSVAAAGLGKRAVRFLGAALEQLLLYPG